MFVYFAIQIGVYGVTFWLPALVGRIDGLSDLGIGFVSALPWVFALLGVLLLPWISDRTGDRRGPLRLALVLTVAGLIGAVVLPPVAAIGALVCRRLRIPGRPAGVLDRCRPRSSPVPRWPAPSR